MSSRVDGADEFHDLCLSLPSIVNRGGIEKVLHLNLNTEEEEKLRASARVLRATLDQLKMV